MSLLYTGLRQILRLAVELYYVDVQSVGRTRIPAGGPVIFAANHPNSIMDTVILGTQTQRQISYMAKSGLFRNPLVAMLFNQCGVIPVHRSPEGGKSNDDAFRTAFEVLHAGGTIGIFPEGRNSMEREMYEIKTGTARIALGAEARNEFALGVKIVPVGLNFEDRDRFLSSVLVRFGEPIDVRKWGAAYAEDERAAVKDLTDHVQARLRELATHIEGARAQDLVRDIHTIYGRRLLEAVLERREEDKRGVAMLFDDLRDEDGEETPLLEDLFPDEEKQGLPGRVLGAVKGGRDEDLDDQFFLKKRIAQAIQYYDLNDPEMVRAMRQRVWLYKDHLRQVQLRHDFFDRPPSTLSFRKEAIRFTVYMIVFLIPAAWGLIHNIAPYAVTRFFLLRAPDEAQRAITGLLVGMLAYPLLYAPWVTAVWLATESWPWTLAYLLSLPATGFFFLRYRRQLARYRGRILTRTLFQTEKSLIESLQKEREKLLEDFDRLRERFLEAEEEIEALGDMPAPSFHGVEGSLDVRGQPPHSG